MRDILKGIKILVVSRNFDATFPTDRAIKIQCTGIVKYCAIYYNAVIMEAFLQGPCSGTHPNTVCNFLQRSSSAGTSQSQAYPDTVGMRCPYPEPGKALRIYLRIFLSRLV